MPVTEIDLPVAEPTPQHKSWTRQECEIAQSAGVDLRRYELIEGELILRVSKKQAHMLSLALLMEWLTGIFGHRYAIQEATVNVAPEDNPTSAPEPDAVVLTRSIRELQGPASPSEIRLLVEISDSTFRFDIKTKAGLYGRAGIIEYWVLDINARRMIVHREPRQGNYASVLAYGEDEMVSCLAAPDRAIRVSELL